MIGSDLFLYSTYYLLRTSVSKMPYCFLQAHDTEITFIKFIFGQLFLVLVVVIF